MYSHLSCFQLTMHEHCTSTSANFCTVTPATSSGRLAAGITLYYLANRFHVYSRKGQKRSSVAARCPELPVCLSVRRGLHMLVMLQGLSRAQGSTGRKRSAEAWTLSQSSKSPAKVAAARKGLEGKLSKPSQVRT